MSTPEDFVTKYYPFAVEAEKETGIPAIASMAMAAHETGWGKKAIGNNLFGIKYRKGDWGYREVLTTEHSKGAFDFANEKVKSKSYDKKNDVFVWKLWQFFADYPSPKEAFLAHGKLLLTDRYKPALQYRNDPKKYLAEVARLGYATDFAYPEKMAAMVDSVKRRLPK